jgi:hypothetical protein
LEPTSIAANFATAQIVTRACGERHARRRDDRARQNGPSNGATVRGRRDVLRCVAVMSAATVYRRWRAVVPSLRTAGLRVAYLRAQLVEAPLDDVAGAIDVLGNDCDAADPTAATVMHALVALLTEASIDPKVAETRDALRAIARARSLHTLGRLVRRPYVAPTRGLHHEPSDAEHLHHARSDESAATLDIAIEEEAPHEKGVPDYGKGRPLTLGERKSLARRPPAEMLPRLLADPHPDVIRMVLGSSRLTEELVVRVATKRPGRAEVLGEIARHPRWCHRPRVRLSLVLNPATPVDVAIAMSALLLRGELQLVSTSQAVHPALRAAALERFGRLPPMPKGDGSPMQ